MVRPGYRLSSNAAPILGSLDGESPSATIDDTCIPCATNVGFECAGLTVVNEVR